MSCHLLLLKTFIFLAGSLLHHILDVTKENKKLDYQVTEQKLNAAI